MRAFRNPQVSRRYSRAVIFIVAVLVMEVVPIVITINEVHRSDHQWCALVTTINHGPTRPVTAYGRKVAAALEERARSLGCTP